MSAYDTYNNATTVADLYGPHPYYSTDFEAYVAEPAVDPASVDVSGISNSTSSKEDFLRTVFSTKFHVVWGRFDTNPFGPAYLMLNLLQTPGHNVRDVLRFSEFGRPETRRELGPLMNVTSNSVSFTGSSFECLLRRTEHEYDGENVWNFQGVEGDKLVYNYYLVPIRF